MGVSVDVWRLFSADNLTRLSGTARRTSHTYPSGPRTCCRRGLDEASCVTRVCVNRVAAPDAPSHHQRLPPTLTGFISGHRQPRPPSRDICSWLAAESIYTPVLEINGQDRRWPRVSTKRCPLPTSLCPLFNARDAGLGGWFWEGEADTVAVTTYRRMGPGGALGTGEGK